MTVVVVAGVWPDETALVCLGLALAGPCPVFFSCLIAMAETSNALRKGGGGGLLVLSLILEERLSLLTAEGAVSCGFVVCDGLPYVEARFLYTHFVESFCQKLVLSFVKCLAVGVGFASTEVLTWILISCCVDVVCEVVDVRTSLQPWNKSHLVTTMIFRCVFEFIS